MTSIHLLNLTVFVCGWERRRERWIDRQQLARPDKILSLIMRGPCPIWDLARAGLSSQRCRCHMSELAPFTILSNFSLVRSFSGVILSGSGAVSRPVWCGDYRTPFMFPVVWQWRQRVFVAKRNRDQPCTCLDFSFTEPTTSNCTGIMIQKSCFVCFIISNPCPCHSFYAIIWYAIAYYHIYGLSKAT